MVVVRERLAQHIERRHALADDGEAVDVGLRDQQLHAIGDAKTLAIAYDGDARGALFPAEQPAAPDMQQLMIDFGQHRPAGVKAWARRDKLPMRREGASSVPAPAA